MQYLASDDFKAKITVLVDDLVSNHNTPTYVYRYGTIHLPNLILLYSSSDGLTLTTIAALAGAASSPAGIIVLGVGSIVYIAKWLFEVYQNRCVSRS